MISGEKLRLLRNWKGLPQKQAAKLLGISQPAYSKMEKKKEINGLMLEKVKKAFNCSDEDIDQLNNLPPPPTDEIITPILQQMPFPGHLSNFGLPLIPHTSGYKDAPY